MIPLPKMKIIFMVKQLRKAVEKELELPVGIVEVSEEPRVVQKSQE